MKSLLKSTYSKTKLLIVLFAFSCGSLMMAQAEDTHSLFMGLVRSGPPDHGTPFSRRLSIGVFGN